MVMDLRVGKTVLNYDLKREFQKSFATNIKFKSVISLKKGEERDSNKNSSKRVVCTYFPLASLKQYRSRIIKV
jgi:hypothetical protein